jgi:PAS domain S-box-containing protein
MSAADIATELAELAREKDRYAEFFRHAPDALVITDANGRVREVNEAALELLNAARDNVVSRPLAECVPGEIRMQSRAITLKGDGGRGLCWLIRPPS